MNDNLIKALFKKAEQGFIHLEFFNESSIATRKVYDYNVYFQNERILYAINKYPKTVNGNKIQRKWGLLYYNPSNCARDNKIGNRVTLLDKNNIVYRFTFLSETKLYTFKNKYVLRKTLKKLLNDKNIIKMPFIYEFISSDKLLKKINYVRDLEQE